MKISDEILNSKKQNFEAYDGALATLLFIILNVAFMGGFRFVASNTYVSMLGLIVAQFLVEALFGVASLLVAKICRVNIIKAAGLNKKVNLKMVVYCVLIALVSLIFFVRLTAVFMEILDFAGYSSDSGSLDVSTFPKYIGYVIAACVTPAICEELLFRGTILSSTKKIGKWFSILFSAFIFMLMHGSPDQTMHQFIIGALLGYIFFETGNLWLGVIVHFTNNFIAITESYLLSVLSQAEETATEVVEETVELTRSEMAASIVFDFIMAIVFAVIGYMLIKLLVNALIRENNKLNAKKSKELKNANAIEISVDGEKVLTDAEISSNEEILNKKVKNEDAKESMPKSAKILFGFSIAWLVIDWILELINGFLI